MRKGIIKMLVPMLIMLGMVETIAQGVKVKDSKRVDYATLETFTIKQGEFTVPEDELAGNIDANKFFTIIKEHLTRELELKGYVFTEDSTADFNVDYVAGAFHINEGENLGPLGGTPASTPAQADRSNYWSNSYREGLLVIELRKFGQADPSWTAESSVNMTNVDLSRAVASSVARSFKKFPKRGKKRK